MAVDNSLSQSIDKIVKRYSSLFVLPSYNKLLLLLALACIGGGILSVRACLPSPLEALVEGFFLGVSLLFVNLIFDYIVSTLVLRKDPIYDLRRTAALSFFSWILWLFFIFIGVAMSIPFGFSWFIKLCLLGFSAVLILRLITFKTTSSASYNQIIIASIFQPLPCVIPFLRFWTGVNYSRICLFLISSLAVGLLSSFLFISLVNRVGKQTFGIPSLSFFKAFLLNWIAGLNKPFEKLLEKLGEEQDVKVSVMKFDASRPKAVIVVPSIHPGPFKNVGSSLLPSMIKTEIEKRLNCVACVPHGLLGHELDLASQKQNQKIINKILNSVEFKASEPKATPFIKVTNGLATACCQVFGKSAFLSFTLAPETTEDLPQKLGFFVDEEAEKNGLANCLVVNAHNSINGVVDTQEALNDLEGAATNCLEKVASLRRSSFEVGAATVTPTGFSLRDGMGPGGIAVIVVKVKGQKTAYVVIDGNNMISGLREKICSILRSVGVNEGEVFTTDTHSVNALILSGRGYHPIGEAMNQEKLIGYIKKATLNAASNLERAKSAVVGLTVPNIKVIGEKKLEALCLLADRTVQKAKEAAVLIFVGSGLLLMVFLMFL